LPFARLAGARRAPLQRQRRISLPRLPGVLFISRPVLWVSSYILAKRRQFALVANDVLIVVTLPHHQVAPTTQRPDAARNCPLIPANERSQRSRRPGQPTAGTRTSCRGAWHAPATRLLSHPDNRMYVIRHHDKRIQFSLGPYQRRPQPFAGHNFAPIIEAHFAIHDLSPDALLLPGAQCHEVTAWQPVVETGKPYGASPGDVIVVILLQRPLVPPSLLLGRRAHAMRPYNYCRVARASSPRLSPGRPRHRW